MRFVCLLSLLLFASDSIAQQRTVIGTVMDAGTKEPIAYCTVVVWEAKPLATFTDGNGRFKLELLPRGANPKVVVSFIGYKIDTIEIIGGKNEYLIFLKPMQSQIDEIVVTGVSKATLIRENPVAIVSVSPKAIDKTNESNVIDV